MKKRIGAILLTVCMLLGLLPTAALAEEAIASDSPWKLIKPGETETDQTPYYGSVAVKSFEELKKAVETVPDDIKSEYEPTLSIWIENERNNDKFTWPETGGELTIDFGGDQKPTSSCVPEIEIYGSCTDNEEFVTWEIPKNVTITCYEDIEKDYYSDPVCIVVNGTLNLASEIKDYYKKIEIVVNGTLNCMNGADLETVSSITVNDGGKLIANRAELAQSVVLNQGATMEMGERVSVFDLTVHSSTKFTHTSNYDWYLFGTLTLDDGVELDAGSVALWTSSGNHSGNVNAAIVADGTAVFDGSIYLDSAFGSTASLTLQGDLTMGPILADTNRSETDESKWGKAEINVPAGSYVKATYINEDIYGADSDLTIHVVGTLEFDVNGGTGSWKIGDLVLGETAEDKTVTEGTVILRPSADLFADYTDEKDPVSSKVTGNGTIKMYARVCPDDYFGWGWYPSLFGWDAFESDDPSPLYNNGYIANTVTIWQNWNQANLNCTHRWDAGEITREPTETRDGEKLYTCTECGTEKVEKIPATSTGTGDSGDSSTTPEHKQQEVSWVPADPITVTYGVFDYVRPTAYNDTVEDCVFTYTSSDENVATVNENGRVTIVGAGTATITATAAAVADYAETSASYTLTVNKASLTVTANNKTIAYGEAPAHDGYVVDGLVNGEDASVLTGAPVYGYTYEQYGNAGTYAINVSGLTAKNYEIAFKPGTLTVEKATAYTVTLGKLEQVAGHTSAVTASISPVDSTAVLKVEYQVSGQWTETVPDDPGSYAVRISLTDSDNIALDDTFTTDTLVVKNGVTVDGANVDAAVTVENGKAALTIEDPAEVAVNASGDVSIDLGGISGAEELELPAALLTGLSENENTDSLTVATEDASVKLSGEVLDTVAEAVTSSEDAVTLRLTAVEKNDLNDKQQAALDSIGQDAVIVEVSLVVTHTDGSETELHELGGSAEITVPYAGTVPEGKYIVVSYVSSDGSVSYVRATYNRETGQVSFKTDHFSHYALFLSSRNTYRVNVINGSGSGTYLEGSTVTVRADSRSGYTFTGWEVVSGAVTLANANDSQTTFIVSAGDVTLKAVYTENTVWPVLPAQPAQPVKPAAPVDPAQPSTPFADVPAGSYYASAVYWAVEQGLTTGLTATRFAPDGTCTRAQLVTFLWRGSGCPAVDYAMDFSDVAEDEWYTEAVRWAASAGIVQGYDNGLFGTNDTVTREQMVTILYHYAQAMGMDVSVGADTNILSFRDALSVSEYAVEAMQWAVGADIVQGYSGELMPKSACTRAQIVTILYRLLGQK